MKKRKEANLKYFKLRAGEEIGGGYFVFRRHSSSGRIKIDPKGIPFEHPDLASAQMEADRLALMEPGKTYCVAHIIRSVVIDHCDPPGATFTREDAEEIAEILVNQ